MNLRAIALIFARGGSKGIPRKNIRHLAGKPLLAHSILLARGCPFVERVVVSTEDEEIAEEARRFGAETPFMRPPQLATDTAPEWLCWQHAVRQIWGDSPTSDQPVFLSLPTTSPFRAQADVAACLERLQEGFDVVLTVTPARRNPYFNMVHLRSDGGAEVIIGKGDAARRQEAPPAYDVTTVAYAARPSFILSANRIWDGQVGASIVPEERALDIDTEYDFEIAHSLAQSRLA